MKNNEITSFLETECMRIYRDYESIHGTQSTNYFGKILSDLKEKYEDHITSTGQKKDTEQAWRSRKGSLFEFLVKYALESVIDDCNCDLKVFRETEFAQKAGLKDKLQIDFGESLGKYIPDADIVLCDGAETDIFAIFSCKATLRERVAQSAYWKRKIQSIDTMSHIKYFLITLDEDKVFAARDRKSKPSKPRAIAEAEFDCTYVCSLFVHESEKVKNFSQIGVYLGSVG